MSTLVSVVTPCFNASKYIHETYASLVEQTHKNWEWIIVDDRSTDDSFELIKTLQKKDSRIKVLQNDTNSGPSRSRNVGLENAQGEFVAFLDADDLWLPSKLERQLNFMGNDIHFSCHDYVMMDESGQNVSEVRIRPVELGKETFKAFNPIATSFNMLRRSKVLGLSFREDLKRRQDWVFWYEMLDANSKVHILDEVLGRYRKDSIHSISKNKFKMAQIQWQIYRTYFKQGLFEAIVSFIKYAKYGIRKHYL